MGKKESMFADFKKLSKKEWANKATSDLKGVDVYEKYGWQLGENSIDPYFDSGDLEKIKNLTAFDNRLFRNDDPSGEPRVWVNLQKIKVVDLKDANKIALDALNNGADGIEFDLQETEGIAFEILLSEILLDFCSISISNSTFEDCMNYIKYLSTSNQTNVIGGFLSMQNSASLDTQIQLIELSQKFSEIRCIEIAAEANSEYTDQIANILLLANLKIRSLLLGGLSIESAINSLFITTTIGTDYFVEIAKVRALRNLFFQLAHAYGHEKFLPEDIHIKCVSLAWEDDHYQPNANMLKSSTAAMAAIIGGCDSLLIEPNDYDSTLSVRIARNVSLILKEESFLSKTADPVAGSYYIESLTDQLAKSSWKLFQKNLEESTIEQ
jgi:methylmalonyl-CoA mutase